MKHLVMLLSAVAILFISWLVLRAFTNREAKPPTIEIPANLADKPALVRSAHQLWNAAPGYYDGFQVAALMKILAQNLDDESWRAVSAPVYFAWMPLRGTPAVRAQLLEIEDLLLPHFLQAGALQEIEGLVRMSGEQAFDSTKISTALEKYVTAPMSAAAFPGSRCEEIIAATIHAASFPRAEQFLAKLSWPQGDAPEDKSAVSRLRHVIEACRPSVPGAPKLSRCAAAWEECARDNVGRVLLQANLEEVGLSAIAALEEKPASPQVAELFEESAAASGAERYWSRILSRVGPTVVRAGDGRVNLVARLVHLTGERFKKTGFEFEFWMKVGDWTEQWMEEDPLRAVRFYERAQAAAVADAHRVQVARKLVGASMRAYEFAQARKFAEQAEQSVKEPESKKAAAELLADARKKEAADLARVELQKKNIDLDRRRGRLQAMKDNLAAAKRSGRPSDQIQAIEKAIKELEAQVTE